MNLSVKLYGIPFLETGWYGPLALLLTIIGVACTLWLIVWTETSGDMPFKPRIIGIIIRLILMAFFLGLGIHFYLLSEEIYL
ncbi:MAG: hypothetical protein ACFFCQ_09560 [Promethearchaeota archaeon]